MIKEIKNSKHQMDFTAGIQSNAVISESNTLTNSYDYKIYSELYEQNVSTASFFFMAANSLTNDDIKLSERLYVPSKKLRGFERGKIGPLDGDDYIGGNFVSVIILLAHYLK